MGKGLSKHETHDSGPDLPGERQYVAECLGLPVVTEASTLDELT